MKKEIAAALRKVGSKKCIEKAEILENESSNLTTLHLRDLGLTCAGIKSITDCFEQENSSFKSISLSYNHLLGNEGVIILMKKLPKTFSEIGLVNCGISDDGGVEILNWMKNSTNLKMICMEQNNFSEKLRANFQKFNIANPQILVVY